VSKSELGRVLDDLPKIPGAEHPYKLPEVVAPASPDIDNPGMQYSPRQLKVDLKSKG
jgi:hypothetical protein